MKKKLPNYKGIFLTTHMETIERRFGPEIVEITKGLLKEDEIEGLFVMEIKDNNTILTVEKLKKWKKKD